MSVVQDFEFHWSQPNPMVRYKIYNKTINLPFDDFCAAIKVPQWGSCEKIRGLPSELLKLYEMMCQGRSFSDESGKIRSIQLPSIRYFAYFNLSPSAFLLERMQISYPSMTWFS